MSENTVKLQNNEEERLIALYEYDILDTTEEAGFDNLIKLASQIFHLPYAAIVLLDRDRVWFKSSIGLDATETPRKHSFCDILIDERDIIEVKDTLLDDRFSQNPFIISEPNFRYYVGAPLIDEDGYYLGLLCLLDKVPNSLYDSQMEMLRTLAAEVMMHLSARKKARLLKMETQRLEEMLNISAFSPEIHAIVDPKGKIVFINGAVTSLLGYTIEEIQQLSIWDICYKSDIPTVRTTIEKGLRGGTKQFDIHFRIFNKFGALRWFSWSLITKNRSWYAYGRDSTENREVQSQLTKLSFVASKINNAVVINDSNNEITWINEAFEKITGFTLEDIRGKRLGDLIAGPETDLDLINQARQQAKRNQSFTVDLLAYRKDKQPIWLSIYNTVVLAENGEVEMEVEIIIDITEKKIVEQTLMDAKEQALQLSESKEMFLSVMSHEIRNPLNAVIGMTHLLLENDPKPSQVEDLKILKFSGENLIHIINDVLDFTKIETGNLELEHIPLSLKSLSNDIINSLQINGNKNGNDLSLDFDEKIPEEVLGDKTRLYQILMNLLGNGIKFTHQGKVSLTVALEHSQDTQVAIEFTVADTGIGIPEDKLSYVFESFTQAKSDTSRKYGGTGLGLAITKKLLKLFKSEIQLKSVEGQGTTFTFSIVFDKVSQDNSIVNRNKQTELFSGKKVLVVDDNEINILIAKRILSNWGLIIDVAANGHEAINKVMENRYDMILMDIHMPGIDGFETTGIIRELEGDHYKQVPIIALTASSHYHESSKFIASGMNGYLLKPFNHDKFKSVLSVYFC
jgi:PAS domain S-box-containing protein